MSKLFCLTTEKGFTLKESIYSPLEQFLLVYILFQKGLDMQKIGRHKSYLLCKKLSPLVKLAENLKCVSSPLKLHYHGKAE